MPSSRSNVRAASGRQSARGSAGQKKLQMKQPAKSARRARAEKSYFDRLPEYTKCVLNPFDMPACGYPDFFNEPTTKLKLVDSYTLTSDANGVICLGVAPSLARAKYTYTVTGGIASAGAYTAHPDYTEVTAASAYARTVCFGVKVEYIGAAMTASGTLTVSKDTALDVLNGADVNAVQDDGVTAPAKEGRMVPLFPRQAVLYEGEASASFGVPTFPTCNLVAVGLPVSTTCFRVTVVRHVEVLPYKKSATMRGSSTLTAANMAAFEAISRVNSEAQSTPTHYMDAIGRWAASAVGSVARSVGGDLIDMASETLSDMAAAFIM